jgi:hypothetical protein
MRWATHVAGIEELENGYKIVVGKLENEGLNRGIL